jgi:hypothetical protein
VTCRAVNEGGMTMIVCGPRSRQPRPECVACVETAAYLCDWPLDNGKTCDQPICKRHARERGPDNHICPRHQFAADHQPRGRSEAQHGS